MGISVCLFLFAVVTQERVKLMCEVKDQAEEKDDDDGEDEPQHYQRGFTGGGVCTDGAEDIPDIAALFGVDHGATDTTGRPSCSRDSLINSAVPASESGEDSSWERVTMYARVITVE